MVMRAAQDWTLAQAERKPGYRLRIDTERGGNLFTARTADRNYDVQSGVLRYDEDLQQDVELV
jgi:hypothetical protein